MRSRGSVPQFAPALGDYIFPNPRPVDIYCAACSNRPFSFGGFDLLSIQTAIEAFPDFLAEKAPLHTPIDERTRPVPRVIKETPLAFKPDPTTNNEACHVENFEWAQREPH